MSQTLEIVHFERKLPYRSFIDMGMTVGVPHFHKEIEIIFCKKGVITIGIDNQMVQLHEGEIIYFAGGKEHYFLAARNSMRYVYQFDLDFLENETLRETDQTLMKLLDQGESHSSKWPAPLKKSATRLLNEAYAANEANLPGSDYQILGCLQQLLGQFMQYLPKRADSPSVQSHNMTQYRELLERTNVVLEYVEGHFDEPIRISDVAKQVGFSDCYFTKVFKKMTGETFMTFLEKYRIRQAKFILGHEKIPMVEVSERAGFGSVKTFHHVFKKEVGVSPLQYQKEILKLNSETMLALQPAKIRY